MQRCVLGLADVCLHMCMRSCGFPDPPACVQWQRRWHRAGVVSSWPGLQGLLHGGLLQLWAAVWGWVKTRCRVTSKYFHVNWFKWEKINLKKTCLGVYRVPERSCPTAAEHYSTPSVRCRELPFTQHPSHMPLERFLQSPEAQGSNCSAGNTNISFPAQALHTKACRNTSKGYR